MNGPQEGSEFSTLAEVCDELGLGVPWAIPRRESFGLPDGRHLSTVSWGAGPPEVIFLHGGALNARTWDATALVLQRPAMAIDLPGHGHSSWRDDATYDPRDAAADVAVVLRSVLRGPAMVVGMSFGGLTAVSLAASHPGLVRTLVVIDITPDVGTKPSPNVAFVRGPTSFASLDEMIERAAAHYPDRALAGLRRGVRHNARQREDGRWVWRHHMGNLGPGGRPERDADALWALVEGVDVPIVLVLGGASWAVDAQDVRKWLHLQPTTRVEVVDGAGHAVQGSHPAQLAAILRSIETAPPTIPQKALQPPDYSTRFAEKRDNTAAQGGEPQ